MISSTTTAKLSKRILAAVSGNEHTEIGDAMIICLVTILQQCYKQDDKEKRVYLKAFKERLDDFFEYNILK